MDNLFKIEICTQTTLKAFLFKKLVQGQLIFEHLHSWREVVKLTVTVTLTSGVVGGKMIC